MFAMMPSVWIATASPRNDDCCRISIMRAKHGGVPQAATGLSEAREEAERLASPGTRLGLLFCARKNLLSIYRFHYILLYLFF